MKIKHLIPIFAMAIYGSASAQEQGLGIRMENFDTSAAPGADFYQYACGGWMKNHPLAPEYARFGSFDVVAENNKKQMRELIEELTNTKHEFGTVEQKIGDTYALMMDSTRQNKDGVKPILADLKAIAKAKTREQLVKIMAQNGVYGAGQLWGTGIGADMMSSKDNLLEVTQGGLTLGLRDYYLNDDDATKKIREGYKTFIVNAFKLVGETQSAATTKMEHVMSLETRMAKACRTNTELRDPASNYHKMSYDDFKAEYKGIDWDAYWKINFIEGVKELNVGQPHALKEAVAIIGDTPVEELRDWLQWQLLVANTSHLGDDMYAESFNFFGKVMSGKKEQQPRWKRSVSAVNGVLGEAVGQMYVKKFFPPENKERMKQLVKNLQAALADRIDAQEWMSDSTKQYAKEKLSTFYVKIGYPDKWRDYSGLTIDPKKSLYENSKAIGVWASKDEVGRKFGKPVDPNEWYMTPQTVNAYYNPTTNEICFPAGILQYPFFDMTADDAFNYGAIGVVIGHEMTHGFDDQGRQFDKEGNFRNWWAAGDGDKFKERAQVMVDFFSAIKVLPDLNGNGALTLGENLADHGGLQVSYEAFKKATAANPLPVKEGLTPEQRFFISYASVWATNITDEEIRSLTTRDSHSLGKWRVNGALPHIDAWYDAFHIDESSPMFVPKEKRVAIW